MRPTRIGWHAIVIMLPIVPIPRGRPVGSKTIDE